MREMGIVDEGLALRALQIMGGDLQVPKFLPLIYYLKYFDGLLQAAVDLIFSGWEGEDEAMQ